jgi:hypothetical protein
VVTTPSGTGAVLGDPIDDGSGALYDLQRPRHHGSAALGESDHELMSAVLEEGR